MGIVFDSSGGFRLPNGAMRAPDAAWIHIDRWNALSLTDQEKFSPLTPDFIIEVRSKSDSLRDLKNKMKEWIDNGCQLAWLIDPIEQRTIIYFNTRETETIESFNAIVKAETIVSGFQIDLSILK